MKRIVSLFIFLALCLSIFCVGTLSVSAATTNLGLGQPWVVDGQWEFTIDNVDNHYLCSNAFNQRYGFTNEQVVMIEYSYKNIGYYDEIQDLYFGGLSGWDVYDADGEAATYYGGCVHSSDPKECITGTKCSGAHTLYVLKNPSDKITIKISQWSSDGSGNHIAIFNVPVGKQNIAENDVKVTINGKKVDFDVQPTIINGRTMVPMRAVFEELGAVVVWNGATQTVNAKKGDTKVQLTINDNIMYVNNIPKTLDVTAMLLNGRTLVPVRAISEAFGCDVKWLDKDKIVQITSNDI